MGAGVSVSRGLPDWNTLLQKLILSTITVQDDQRSRIKQSALMAKVIANIFSPNPLISARYLALYYRNNYSEDPLAFTKAVRNAIYDEMYVRQEKDLVEEIKNLCVPLGKKQNLECVISYNYDDLLETSIKDTKPQIPFCSIYRTGIHPRAKELAIYHVHGFLPRDEDLSESNQITLSDDSYHNQYNDVYSWNNLIQINKFKDSHCLFVGVSFTDPNLRRLLDIAKRQRGDDKIHHYCFRKRYSAESIKTILETILKSDQASYEKWSSIANEGTIKTLIDIIQDYETRDAESFGVGVIWINKFDEIPELLISIRDMSKYVDAY